MGIEWKNEYTKIKVATKFDLGGGGQGYEFKYYFIMKYFNLSYNIYFLQTCELLLDMNKT